tara:strand:+ start:535 stop:885 length:351 start_codon:yes stop_codon:yes gene_type:complete
VPLHVAAGALAAEDAVLTNLRAPAPRAAVLAPPARAEAHAAAPAVVAALAARAVALAALAAAAAAVGAGGVRFELRGGEHSQHAPPRREDMPRELELGEGGAEHGRGGRAPWRRTA